MAIISKKKIKILKLFLVSPQLEAFLTISYVLLFAAIIVFRAIILDSPEITYREYDLSSSLALSLTNSKSTTDFINWLSSEIPARFMTPSLSTFKIFGNMRLSQIRVQVPDSCFVKDISQIDSYETTFTEDCNPIVSNNNVEKQITVADPTTCNMDSCTDFVAIYDSSLNIASNYIKYPQVPFIIEFSRDNVTELTDKLQKVQTNGWLHDYKTKILVFELVLLEPSTEILVSYQIQFENITPFFYDGTLVKTVISTYTNSSPVYLVIIIAYLTNGILFIMKSAFELSIQENKYIHLTEMLHGVVQVAFSISTLTNIGRFNSFINSNGEDIFQLAIRAEFFSFNSLAGLYQAEFIIFMILTLAYPIKIFTCLTLSKYMKKFQRLSSAIFRTFPSVLVYFAIAIPLILSWAVIFYLVLGDYSDKFDSYGPAILHFIFFDLSSEIMNLLYRNAIGKTLSVNILLFFMIMTVMRYVLRVFFIAVIAEAYNRSSSLEYHQFTSYEQEDRRFVSNMIRKIERFSKDNLPQTDNIGKNNGDRKMLVWLSFSTNDDTPIMDEIYKKVEEQNIHLVQFYSLNEIIQFLKYLFKLKPNLLHKSANQFRIVIDSGIEEAEKERMEKYNQEEQTFDMGRVENLLNWLRYIGSKVPLMIYSTYKLKYDIMLKMRLKYQLLYFSTSLVNLTRFSIMESLDHVVEAYGKEDSESISGTFELDEDISNSEIVE